MFYVDRLKDTFKNRGLQVAPSEISNLILEHLSEYIAEVVVIGVPSPSVGEEAWAYLMLTEKGDEKIGDRVRELCRVKLSKHKWIARVVVLDDFPRGPTHKVLVRELRTHALQTLDQEKPRHQAKL